MKQKQLEVLDEKFLNRVLSKPVEKDWLEFKGKMKLYQSDGKLAEQPRDELIKDILGLANGNSHSIRKTKYLIVGVDDKKIDENGMRVLYDTDYRLPSPSEITKWLKDACSPAVVGLECNQIKYKDVRFFIITIPPTFDLHETTRDLVTPKGNFYKHTVFMRQDEHIFPASVRDGVIIQQLKHLYRQEIANPSSIWIGAITGGVVSFVISGAILKLTKDSLLISESFVQILLTCVGIYFGTFTGWAIKQFNETRYDWRYWTLRQRVYLIVFLIILAILAAVYFLLPK